MSGTGHISWQTMHGVSAAHGRQRSLSMTATPMTCLRFSLERERAGWRRRGRPGRRRGRRSRSTRGATPGRASTGPRARPRAASAGGRTSGTPSCTRCSAGSCERKRAFVLGARRPDQARALDGARHAGAEERRPPHAGARGDHELAAARVVGGPGARPAPKPSVIRRRAGRRRGSPGTWCTRSSRPRGHAAGSPAPAVPIASTRQAAAQAPQAPQPRSPTRAAAPAPWRPVRAARPAGRGSGTRNGRPAALRRKTARRSRKSATACS